jgi:hypothetical protein
MFSRLASRKNHYRRRTNRRAITKFNGRRPILFGRSSRFEHLEDRWLLAPIAIQPGNYAGGYAVAGVTSVLFGPATIDLSAGTYSLGVGSASGLTFNVDAGGNVTSNNADAAQGVGNTLTLSNTTITIDPSNYTGSYGVQNVANSLSGIQNVVVVPNLDNYFVGTGGGNIGFSVDAAGNVTSSDPIAMQASGNSVTLNNTTITIDPLNYTGFIGVQNVAHFLSGVTNVVVVPNLNNYFVSTAGGNIRFSVDAAGNVSSSDPIAMQASGNTLTLSNTSISIDPANYVGSYAVQNVAHNLSGVTNAVVVPNLNNYFVSIPGGNIRFSVDAIGNVTSSNVVAMQASGNTLTLNTTAITIDPGTFTGQYGVQNAADFLSGIQDVILVPNLNDFRLTVTGSGTFTFSVDAYGQPNPTNIPVTVAGQVHIFSLCAGVDNPVGWWQAEGNALDSADGNDGQLLNGATFAAGQVGQAFSFDGRGQAIRIPETASDLDGFTELTISAWIRPESFVPHAGVFDELGNSADAIVVKYDSRINNGASYSFTIAHNGTDSLLGRLAFTVFAPDGDAAIREDIGSISLETWTHVAAVWRGGNQFDLYMNGQAVTASLGPVVGALGVMNDNNTPVNIGRAESTSGSFVAPWGFFDGLIDDVRIYRCGLSADEIESIYLEGATRTSIVSGRVFDDLDNDGFFEPGNGEVGLEGVTMTLTGADDQGPVNRSTVSGVDGMYSFADVFAGTYTLTEDQPTGFLDGKETAGTLSGMADNTQDSNTISNIVIGNDGAAASGYDFADIRPSDLLGLVWEDSNNDGQVNFGEKAIESVPITLTGTDDRGNAVNHSIQTDVDGVYLFYDLRPGNYTLTESQPAGFVDGLDVVGKVNGVTSGDNSINDVFSSIAISVPGSVAENYNFGERPTAGGAVTAGQTATIGFWQNNNGQALIETLNGGATSTQLASWLAATLPNMYGASAGANDLSGMTNGQVADFYSDLFRRKKKEADQLGLGGPVKVDAQVMAVALATYVTNQALAGLTAESFGFLVTEHGVGTTTFNVGDSGEAFNVADNSSLAVLDLLFATNNKSWNGVLYDLDHDGDADDDWETMLRTLANDVYSAINEAGDI